MARTKTTGKRGAKAKTAAAAKAKPATKAKPAKAKGTKPATKPKAKPTAKSKSAKSKSKSAKGAKSAAALGINRIVVTDGNINALTRRGINRIIVTEGEIKPTSARARGVTIDDWVGKLDGWKQEAVTALREIVQGAVPEATSSIKWGQPVFELGGPMIFIRSAAQHVTLGFWRGAELAANGHAGLEGEGDRMRHLKLASVAAIDRAQVAALAREAASLNRELGDPTRG